jgi:hypothetical protein
MCDCNLRMAEMVNSRDGSELHIDVTPAPGSNPVQNVVRIHGRLRVDDWPNLRTRTRGIDVSSYRTNCPFCGEPYS